MRSVIAIVTFAMALIAASTASAEKRIFIIANDADGYGIDRCLASGENCGKAAAVAYCRSQHFAQAMTYRKIDPDEITGAVPAAHGNCQGANCAAYVAIECTR